MITIGVFEAICESEIFSSFFPPKVTVSTGSLLFPLIVTFVKPSSLRYDLSSEPVPAYLLRLLWDGVSIILGPEEIYTVIVAPCETVDPSAGLTRVTFPAATESEFSCMILVLKPLLLSRRTASFCDLPTRPVGTVVWPVEIYSMTEVP